MRSWMRPDVPRLHGMAPPPRVWDTATRALTTPAADSSATLYVCGITPYDATHLGHAATYLAFDTLVRAWLDAGLSVSYVQNSTDVDDPLLDRARETGVDWRRLAAAQTDLFRADMRALAVIPPDDYVAVTEVIPDVAAAVGRLRELGLAYEVTTDDAVADGADLYFDVAAAERTTGWRLGAESGLDRGDMLALSAERGGDPDRVGKRDALDPLLWRVARADEPAWDTMLGEGRPGWHIECSVIAVSRLGSTISVQAGGSDLVFPHHEFSSAHATALTGEPFARAYVHAGMVGYDGEKMSKSLGNLVLVSDLLRAGADPRAIRLALLAGHYRSDREWTDADLSTAEARLAAWREWAADEHAEPKAADAGGDQLTERLRAAIADDLDTPAAIAAVDDHVRRGVRATSAGVDAVHALLGVDLR